jgi:hypothetical protein
MNADTYFIIGNMFIAASFLLATGNRDKIVLTGAGLINIILSLIVLFFGSPIG